MAAVPSPDAEGHDHVAELADGGVGQHLLDVVLHEGEEGGDDDGDPADDGDQVQARVAGREDVEGLAENTP